MISRLRHEGPALAVLGLILAAGLVLRVLHNDHGLPYVYYVDEGSHFTKRAVEMFRDLSPGYFQNPSAYTYLLHLVYRVLAVPLGGSEEIIAGYKTSANWVFEISRGLAAILCLAGVVGTYIAGRQLWDRRTGLLAAAILCFAFLPVAFSRWALTDTGTLLPVALVLLGAVRIEEGAGWRTCALTGAAAGLAIGFKYTAGLVILAPALALTLRLVAERDRATLRLAALSALAMGAAALLAFAITNPYFFLDLRTALHQLRGQADLAGNEGKFGQEGESGPLYYVGSLGWGLGVVAALAALAGAALLGRRDPRRLAVLAIFPLAMFLYLSTQSRYFGRWLLPVYPALALLAGLAAAQAFAFVRTHKPRLFAPAVAVGLVALLYQPLAADTRSLAVLGHTDTREVARDWLAQHYPKDLRAVIEPAVPDRFYWQVNRRGKPVKRPKAQFVDQWIRSLRATHIEYGRLLKPATIDRYRRRGYCVIVTMGLVRGRAEAAGDRSALAYYDRLERESQHVYSVSPYRHGATPPPFSFDLSYSYYPRAYVRPGPQVDVYRLDDCTQGYGPRGRQA